MNTFIGSVFLTSTVIGRFAGSFIIKWIPAAILTLINCTCAVLSALPMILASNHGYTNSTLPLAATAVFGFFTACHFACGLTFSDKYIQISKGQVVVILLGSNFGQLFGPFLLDFLAKEYGAQALPYTTIIVAGLMCLIFIMAVIHGENHGTRVENENQRLSTSVEEYRGLLTNGYRDFGACRYTAQNGYNGHNNGIYRWPC